MFFVEVYDKLVSLIVGSYYVTFKQNDAVPSYSEDMARIRKNIGKKLKLDWRSTMSSQRTGILFLIRFN